MNESTANTDENSNHLESKPARTKSRFPWKMLVFTALVVGGFAWAYSNYFYVTQELAFGKDMLSLVTALAAFILVFSWAIWFFFFAKMRLVGLLVFAAPIAFLTLFYPNFSGDMEIQGFTPRFWANEVDYAIVTPPAEKEPTAAGIDLKTTSPNDFSQFMGTNRDMKVAGINLATDWNANPPKELWKHSVGEGWSGFVAVNGYAVTQEQRGEDECVTCYEIDSGELVWNYAQKRRHEDTAAMGKVGPRATPTIHEGRVYATSGTGVLDCIDGATGELIWSADVPSLIGIEQTQLENNRGEKYTMEKSALAWGRSCSPLIYEDKVIVTGGATLDGNQAATVIAFDKVAGEEIYRGGSRAVAYGSPTLATVLGKPQILIIVQDFAVGHDPETGEELWSHSRPGKSSADANCSQVTPISDSKLMLTKGYKGGAILLQLNESQGKFTTKQLAEDRRILNTKMTNPVIFQGHAYSLSNGFAECVEILDDGFKRKWKHRGDYGNGQLLLVGDKLLIHSEDGELILAKADPEGYQQLGEFPTIDGYSWNTICLYGNKVLVRSQIEAACYELPVE